MTTEERFNELREGFGPDGNANKISLKGFQLLSNEEANALIARINDFTIKAELRKMRSAAAGKNHSWDALTSSSANNFWYRSIFNSNSSM